MLLAAELSLAISACMLVYWAFRDNPLSSKSLFLRRVPRQMLYVLIGLLGGGLVGLIIGNYIIAVLLTAGCGILPYVIYRKKMMYRQIKLAEQMVGSLYQLAALYGVCNNVYQAFVQTAKTAPEPLQTVLKELLADWELAGLSTAEALSRLEERIPDEDVRFFCRIITLAEQTGGNVKDVMLQVPESLQERQLLREESRAELKGYTAQAWLLIALVPVFLLAFYLMRPEFIYLLTQTALGKGALSLVLFLTTLAIYFIDRVISPLEGEDHVW